MEPLYGHWNNRECQLSPFPNNMKEEPKDSRQPKNKVRNKRAKAIGAMKKGISIEQAKEMLTFEGLEDGALAVKFAALCPYILCSDDDERTVAKSKSFESYVESHVPILHPIPTIWSMGCFVRDTATPQHPISAGAVFTKVVQEKRLGKMLSGAAVLDPLDLPFYEAWAEEFGVTPRTRGRKPHDAVRYLTSEKEPASARGDNGDTVVSDVAVGGV
ncbi:unnamed protein product, partial [Ectocarpus sp. 12 AP-2014]